MGNKQLYVNIKNCPFDLDYFKDVPIYDIKGVQYVKINSLIDDWKNMFIVDIELSEQKLNNHAGEKGLFGITPNKDFLPCKTCFMEVL